MSTERRQLLRQEPDGALAVHADLSALARGALNDMIVRSDGTAYVGDMGLQLFDTAGDRVTGATLLVTPDGDVRRAADGLEAPNGHALTPDERTLVVAESAAFRLTAYDVAPDGSLHGRRTFAELHPSDPEVPVSAPDGICLDAEGAVWVADPVGRRVIRVREGGEVADELAFDGLVPVACTLGGPERLDLLVCAAVHWHREVVLEARSGRVLRVPVEVPGAGAP